MTLWDECVLNSKSDIFIKMPKTWVGLACNVCALPAAILDRWCRPRSARRRPRPQWPVLTVLIAGGGVCAAAGGSVSKEMYSALLLRYSLCWLLLRFALQSVYTGEYPLSSPHWQGNISLNECELFHVLYRGTLPKYVRQLKLNAKHFTYYNN